MIYIEASADAPLGEVNRIDSYKATDFTPADAILCRNTAPLIDQAYWLIGNHVGCKVLGREIGYGLIVLIKKMKAVSIDELEDRLTTYRDREIAKYTSKGQETKAGAVADRVECVFHVINHLTEDKRTISALIDSINSLFSDNGGARVTLATVHKAKGLEWSKVWLLDSAKLMPSKYARQEWQKKQETNLQYVAYTRAKSILNFIDSKGRLEATE